MTDTRPWLIAIATYHRNEGLARLLDSLVEQAGSVGADVLVVDNDGAGGAKLVAVDHPACTEYVVEPTPGIAAARNAALDRFDERYRGIIFVDDDEWVAADWLSQLTSYQSETAADVVQGPVISLLPAGAPTWIRAGGFFQRRRVDTGTELMSAPTNNTLLTRDAWVQAGRPRFDAAFSETGGSDWDLFWGLRRSGARLRYCNEAVVFEDVQTERMRFAWLARRAMRSGIVHSRVRTKYGDRPLLAVLRGGARAVRYVPPLLAGVITRRTVDAKPFNAIMFELGKLLGLAGYRTYEYQRPPDDPSTAGVQPIRAINQLPTNRPEV